MYQQFDCDSVAFVSAPCMCVRTAMKWQVAIKLFFLFTSYYVLYARFEFYKTKKKQTKMVEHKREVSGTRKFNKQKLKKKTAKIFNNAIKIENTFNIEVAKKKN